jgi:hypothetical protein
MMMIMTCLTPGNMDNFKSSQKLLSRLNPGYPVSGKTNESRTSELRSMPTL